MTESATTEGADGGEGTAMTIGNTDTIGNDQESGVQVHVLSDTLHDFQSSNDEEESSQNFKLLYLRSELLRTESLINEVWAMDENRRLHIDLICSKVDLRQEQRKKKQEQQQQQEEVEECGSHTRPKVHAMKEAQTTCGNDGDSCSTTFSIRMAEEDCQAEESIESTKEICSEEENMDTSTGTGQGCSVGSEEIMRAGKQNISTLAGAASRSVTDDHNACTNDIDTGGKVQNTPSVALDSPDLFARIANKFSADDLGDQEAISPPKRVTRSQLREASVSSSEEKSANEMIVSTPEFAVVSKISSSVSTRSQKKKESKPALLIPEKAVDGPAAAKCNEPATDEETDSEDAIDKTYTNVLDTSISSASTTSDHVVKNRTSNRAAAIRREKQDKKNKRKKRITGGDTSALCCKFKAPVLKNNKRQRRR